MNKKGKRLLSFRSYRFRVTLFRSFRRIRFRLALLNFVWLSFPHLSILLVFDFTLFAFVWDFSLLFRFILLSLHTFRFRITLFPSVSHFRFRLTLSALALLVPLSFHTCCLRWALFAFVGYFLLSFGTFCFRIALFAFV